MNEGYKAVEDAPPLTAADILAAPIASAEAEPLMGTRRQLDILGRQLLAQRSGLESATVVILSQLDQLRAQLDAAFSVLAGLQASADLAHAAATMETPTTGDAEERRPPPTFGAKRREGSTATPATPATPSPTTEGGKNV